MELPGRACRSIQPPRRRLGLRDNLRTELPLRKLLAQWQVSQSMSGAGNCYDNAVAESFFASLKKERLHHTAFATRTEAYDAIERYIEGFYNPSRRHSALGYSTPLQYERQGAPMAA